MLYLSLGGYRDLSAADVLGSFLEGAFAPLAFLWLVIGYFLQQRELAQNTGALIRQLDEIKRQSDQAIIQSELISASERHARLEAFLQVSQIVQHHLGSVVGFLYLSSQGATGNGSVADDEVSSLFGEKTLTDHEIFARRLLTVHLQAPSQLDRFNLFYGTVVRARHSNNFIYTFERLVRLSEASDIDSLVHDSLLGTAYGFLYNLMIEHRQAAPADLADIRQTGHHIRFHVQQQPPHGA